ncbi:MAG: hypothetical protein FD139_2723 [Methylocystaceae bacterium]|nr:MAG: hypothetical protein FD172_2860 [Methylocystaceae bacterium]TXT43775.1 MAG: hypothetical protein FD139_2723 [Methylocystaceae bacterium]
MNRKENLPRALRSPLPIFTTDLFEYSLADQGINIGFGAGIPPRLEKKVKAAAITYKLGNKSVDYVLKNYFRDEADEDMEERADVEVNKYVEMSAAVFEDIVSNIADKADSLGSILCEMTLVRICYSLKVALFTANVGALFETCVLARMILEQLSWGISVDGIAEEQSVVTKRAQGSLSSLRKIYPTAGRIYGYLSNHAHWSYPEHTKSIFSDGGKWTVLKANSDSKAQSLLLVLLVVDVIDAVLESLRPDARSHVGSPSKAMSKKHTLEHVDALMTIVRDRDEAAGIVSLFNRGS